MKVLKTIGLYLITATVPCAILYLVLDGLLLRIGLVAYLLIWALFYTYIDKFLLVLLNAREVIDTDAQLLFQYIKNEAYKTYENVPKIYLYTGFQQNCFVFQSRREWTVVIERRLLDNLNKDQVESLVQFLFAFKQTKKAWYQTKAMGITTFVYSSIYWFLKYMLFLKEDSKLFKLLAVFAVGMCSPFITPMEAIAKKTFDVYVNENLKPVFCQAQSKNFSFEEFMAGHMMHSSDVRELVITNLESYPVLENCRFYEAEA